MLAHEHLAHGAWWFFAPLFWIAAWILIIALIRGIFWRRHRHHHWARGHHAGHTWAWSNENDPRVILAQRYAKGEIDAQEYQSRLTTLNTPPTTTTTTTKSS